MKIRRNSLEYDLQHIRRKSDGFYVPIFAQGGGAKIFWSFAGKTLKAARDAVRKSHAPTKPSVRLSSQQMRHYCELGHAFRARETATFNQRGKIGFYTDYPWRFSGNNQDNPTAELFRACGMNYEFIQSEQVLAGEIFQFAVIFCPGGFGYFFNTTMAQRFREYVYNGGGLLGVCAGAFFPLDDFLGMCRSSFVYFREQGYASVFLNPQDPLAYGIDNAAMPVCYALYQRPAFLQAYPIQLKIFRANGPLFVPRGRDGVSAYFDSNKKYAAIIRAFYGKGRIVLISPHPDAGLGKLLQDTGEVNMLANLKLFKNALLFCAGMDFTEKRKR